MGSILGSSHLGKLPYEGTYIAEWKSKWKLLQGSGFIVDTSAPHFKKMSPDIDLFVLWGMSGARGDINKKELMRKSGMNGKDHYCGCLMKTTIGSILPFPKTSQPYSMQAHVSWCLAQDLQRHKNV